MQILSYAFFLFCVTVGAVLASLEWQDRKTPFVLIFTFTILGLLGALIIMP